MFPGPLATQHGALTGKDGVGPAIGARFPSSSTIAKLSGLWAGVKPRTSPQNASPSGTISALLGSGMAVLMVTAAQFLPIAICAAEGLERFTTGPSTLPQGHA